MLHTFPTLAVAARGGCCGCGGQPIARAGLSDQPHVCVCARAPATCHLPPAARRPPPATQKHSPRRMRRVFPSPTKPPVTPECGRSLPSSRRRRSPSRRHERPWRSSSRAVVWAGARHGCWSCAGRRPSLPCWSTSPVYRPVPPPLACVLACVPSCILVFPSALLIGVTGAWAVPGLA